MLLTDAQLQQIKRIIADHHAAFIVNAISPAAVAPDILADLKAKGLVDTKVASIADAYLYGQVVAAMDDPAVASMSLDEFREWLKKHPVPLSQAERQAVRMAQEQAAQYVRGLGNRVEAHTGRVLLEADDAMRRKARDDIRSDVSRAVEARRTVAQLKSDLGYSLKDWTRDLERVAVTEKHDAMQRGVADAIASQGGGGLTDVAKRPMPTCCVHCARLYIGVDGQPRIFTLSHLEGNGTNVGRRVADWLPVVGSTHPNCQCQLIRVPKGWGFDGGGDLVPGGPLGERVGDAGVLRRGHPMGTALRKALTTPGARFEFQGMPIVVETPAGSIRQWTRDDGGTGETTMLYAYGYIDGTHGADGEEIDCYVGPDESVDVVHVVHQRSPRNDMYDEDKVMLGFPSAADAVAAYQKHYDRPDFFSGVTTMDVDVYRRSVLNPFTGPDAMDPAGPRLTVALDKADPYVPAEVGGQGSLAARLNVRQDGVDGANLAADRPLLTTARTRPPVDDDGPLSPRRLVREIVTDPGPVRPVVDPDDVRFGDGVVGPVVPHTITLPAMSDEDLRARTEQAARTRERLLADAEARRAPVDRMPGMDDEGRVPVRR